MALPAVTSAMRQSLVDREKQTRADLAWLAFRHSAMRCYTDHSGRLHAAETITSGQHAGRLCFVPMPTPEDVAEHPERCWKSTTLERFERTFKPLSSVQPSQNFNHYVNQVVVVFAVAVLEAFLEDAYKIRTGGATLLTPRNQSRSLRTYISIIGGCDPGDLRKPPRGRQHLVVPGFKAQAKQVTDVMGLAKKRNDIVHAQTRKDVNVAINLTMRQLEHSIEFVSDTVQKFLSQARAR